MPGRMSASPDDPRIGVHMLTEFMFCPRAGLISYEEQTDEEHEDPPAQLNNFRYLEMWNLNAIKNQLSRELPLFYAGFALFVFGVIASLVASIFNPLGIAFVVFAAIGFYVFAILYGPRVFTLWSRIKASARAKPKEPNPESTEPASVNWWNLLAAGYEPIRYKEKLIDQRWQIAGLPWRVLRKGNLRIPVFRLKRPIKKLYRQHYARMAAYCHLLEVCEGVESPFGIILHPNSYQGLSVPNSPGSRKAFHQGLLEARQVVHESRNNGVDPPRPTRRGICDGCGRGYPRVHRTDTQLVLLGKTVPVNGKIGVDNRRYHSECGDRFCWTPPHARAHEKKL